MSDDPITAIRTRPAMYVGDTRDGSGVLALALEAISNVADLFLAQQCTALEVTVAADGAITIADDGPGIPVELIEPIFTTDHERATRDGHRPHVHLAAGAGVFRVNALCAELHVTVIRDGAQHELGFARGVAIAPRTSVPSTAPTGTTIRMRPDPQIFTPAIIDVRTLWRRLDDLAYLLPGLRIVARDERRMHAPRGLSELVERMGGNHMGPLLAGRGTVDGIEVDVALGWRWRSLPTELRSFANLKPTKDGTHVRGLLDALAAFTPGTRRAALQRGLVAAVSVVTADIAYGRPTQEEPITPALHAAVYQITVELLRQWAAEDPDAVAQVLAHARLLTPDNKSPDKKKPGPHKKGPKTRSIRAPR